MSNSKVMKNIGGDVNRGSTNGNLSVGTRMISASLSLRGHVPIEDVRTDIEGLRIDESASKVLDKIMELLLSAGWEIGLKKRKGRVEEDVVYYNLKGKPYWSIVSAYEDLKLHCESGDGIGKFYSRDFQFVPISQHKIDMLFETPSNKKRKANTKVAQKNQFGCKNYHFVDTSEDPNDDVCLLCGDDGDILCCDSCPSTYHPKCLKMDKLPSGDWHCSYCQCKICGLATRNSQGHLASDSLTCCLCDHKYHKSCLNDNNDHSRDAYFCGNRCKEVYEKLERLVGVKNEIGHGLSLTITSRSDDNVDSNSPQALECDSKLEDALSILEDCFMPQYDNRSGIYIMESVLYNCGSNFNRLNYRRFVTAILERGDEIICVATLRVHGNNVAEMPYITTSHQYRRQGMCRKFLTAIETTLSSLGVELLLISSIPEHVETWSSAFGFQQMNLETKKAIENMNLVVFSNAIMLHRKIQCNGHDSLIVAQHGADLISTRDPNPGMNVHDLEEPSNVNYNNEALFLGSSYAPLADDGAFHPSNANDEAHGSDLPPIDASLMNIVDEHGNDDDNVKIAEKDDPATTVVDEAVNYTLDYLRNLL